jgi:hypothetical protein
MDIHQFLTHHGIERNPFLDEDAQTDLVFKDHCIATIYHPTWDKIFGNPGEPATAVVFGEKGSGKTATRLQIVRHLADYNRTHPGAKVFVIQYDDLNPFLDRFRDTLSRWRRRPDRLLGQWQLWDHMDAILSLGVTRLVDWVLETKRYGKDAADHEQVDAERLDRLQSRDLLLLAACYDKSLGEPFSQRWHRLRRKLRFRTWKTRWPLVVGIVATVVILAMFIGLGGWGWLITWWPYAAIGAAWLPWLWQFWRSFTRAWGIARQVRVVHHDLFSLQGALSHFAREEITGQPLPNKDRTDDRYELLAKLQNIVAALGFSGIIVLVDRVDEPHVVTGSAERMRALIWPLLDNKLLKQAGIGFKLLLPIELAHFIEREDREFYQRARLDKQNVIPSLQWTGEALFDVANARIKACAQAGKSPKLHDLLDERLGDGRLIDAFRGLRVPRHMFKFLYRLFVAHCNAHTVESPQWRISSDMFESQLALYRRDQEAFDRGAGAG